MKFIKHFLPFIALLITSCNNSDRINEKSDIKKELVSQAEKNDEFAISNTEMIANCRIEYKIINDTAKKIAKKIPLELKAYGFNCWYSSEKKSSDDKILDFYICFALMSDRKTSIEVEKARRLLLSVTEFFINEVNQNHEIKNNLAKNPLTEESIKLRIYFKDHESIGLGQGVSEICLQSDLISYERYNISEYYTGPRGEPFAKGKHVTFKKESYEEAKAIVMSQGGLIDFN